MERALELAEKALDLDDTFAYAYRAAAFLNFKLERIDDAVDREKMAFELEPGDAQTRSSYGFYLGFAGRAEEGLGHIREALRLSPSDLVILHHLGTTYRAAGQFDKAIGAYEQYFERSPHSFGPTSQAAAAYMQGEAKELEMLIARAEELKSASSDSS